MVVQILADVHGDFEALEAALASGRERGAERLVVLGDLVDAFNHELSAGNQRCVERIVDAHPWLWLRGNHDTWAIRAARSLKRDAKRLVLPIGLANEIDQRAEKTRVEFGAMFVHSNPLDPDGLGGVMPPQDLSHPLGSFSTSRALSDAGTRLLFVAHTHAAFVEVFAANGDGSEVFGVGDGPVRLGGREAVINPGSVASPRQVVDGIAVFLDPSGGPSRTGAIRTPPSYALWNPQADTIELVAM